MVHIDYLLRSSGKRLSINKDSLRGGGTVLLGTCANMALQVPGLDVRQNFLGGPELVGVESW